MSGLSVDKQNELIRAVIGADDSCVHNFAPAFALIAGWQAEALREAAEGWSPTSRVSGGYVASLLRRLADEIDPALAPQDPA